MVDTFKILITEEANFKLEQYYKLADKEIGGLFEVEITDNEIKIVDTLLIKQEVTGGDFKLDEDALSTFSKQMFIKTPEKMPKFKGWWHKHPIKGWSGHDDNTFETLLDTFGGAIVGLVYQDSASEDDKILCRIDMKDDRSVVSFNTLNFEVIKGKIDRKKLRKFCKKEYKDKINEKVYVTPVSTFNTNWNLWDRYDDRSKGFVKNQVTKHIPEERYSQYSLRDILTDNLRHIVIKEMNKDNKVMEKCRDMTSCTYCEFCTVCNLVKNEKEENDKIEVDYYG